MTSEFDYTQEFNSYPAVELAIANFCSLTGHSFSKTKSTGKFNKGAIPLVRDKPNISTSSRQPELAPKDGSLFIIIGVQQLSCRFSKKWKTSKMEGAVTSNDHQYGRKNTRERMFVSADHNCKAKLLIREALCFPFDKEVKDQDRKRQQFKRAVLESLEKGDLSAHPHERRFIVAFPKEGEHSDHPKGEKKSSKRVRDPSFSETLLMNLRKVYKELVLCDTELMCNDGVVLKAHWLILALHSDYLRKLAVSLKNQKRLVKLDIESSVMKSLLEYCYEGSFDVSKDSCKKIEAAASFLQLKEVLKILKTADPACKKSPKLTTTSHQKYPSPAEIEKGKPLIPQELAPFTIGEGIRRKKQLPRVDVSTELSVTPKQESNSDPTKVSTLIPVTANQPSVSSDSTDLTSTTPQGHMSTTMKQEGSTSKIPYRPETKSVKKRALLPKPESGSLSSQPLPAPALVMKVKAVPLVMMTNQSGQLSYQIGDTQSKGPIISNVVSLHSDHSSNQMDPDDASSVDEHSQAKHRRVSYVSEDATSNEPDMISPRSIYFDDKNSHSFRSVSSREPMFNKDSKEDTPQEEDDTEERLHIKEEPMDGIDDAEESGLCERATVNEKTEEDRSHQELDSNEESLGIKVETIDGSYTVYERSPGSEGHSVHPGEAPQNQNSDCESSSLDEDLGDVGTVCVKTEFDDELHSDSSTESYPTVTFPCVQNAVNYRY